MAFDITEIQEEIFSNDHANFEAFMEVANEPSTRCLDAFTKEAGADIYYDVERRALVLAEGQGIDNFTRIK